MKMNPLNVIITKSDIQQNVKSRHYIALKASNVQNVTFHLVTQNIRTGLDCAALD